MAITVDLALAQRVAELVDCGITAGIGRPVLGEMCVEAAVCYALGLPHGDKPTCVGVSVRSVVIVLNDVTGWLDDADRARGMRRVAIAQLGSDQIDQTRFADVLANLTMRLMVPRALRAASSVHPSAEHRESLDAAAKACEEAARAAARAAAEAARAAAWAAWAAAEAAAWAAWAAAEAARAARAAAEAARAAARAARAAARAAEAARGAKKASAELHYFSEHVLLAALRECGSPGVALLDQLESGSPTPSLAPSMW